MRLVAMLVLVVVLVLDSGRAKSKRWTDLRSIDSPEGTR
jgi:hypothetical protein